MNKADRQKVANINQLVTSLKDRMEELAEAEQEKADNMIGTNLEGTERAEKLAEMADHLMDTVSAFEEVIEMMENLPE